MVNGITNVLSPKSKSDSTHLSTVQVLLLLYREEEAWSETKQNKVACPSFISLHKKSLCDQRHLVLAKR